MVKGKNRIISLVMAMGLVMGVSSYVNAEKAESFNDVESSSVNKISARSSNHEQIQLNKEYTYINDSDNKILGGIDIKFTLPENGYIILEKSDIMHDKYPSKFKYATIFLQREFESSGATGFRYISEVAKDYKIGLKKGTYYMELDPGLLEPGNYFTYKVRFEEDENLVDLEPNEDIEYNNQVKVNLNKEYEALFDRTTDVDRFYFSNDVKRDIVFKFKSDSISGNVESSDKNINIEICQELESGKLNGIKSINLSNQNPINGWYEFRCDRLPEGNFRAIITNKKSKVHEYKFKIEVKELSYLDSINGKNIYETAGLIADEQDYSSAILVNTTKTIADGLSASGLAGSIDAPILLTEYNSIPVETQQRLNNVSRVYIVGGPNVISKNIENSLIARGIKVKRLYGNDRYETSYAVAKEIASMKTIQNVFLVNGYKGEADSMSISPVANIYGDPIILTNGSDIPFKVGSGIQSYVIGGTAVMSNVIQDKTKGIRLGGIDRFETNKYIIQRFYKTPEDFYVVNSNNLVNALLGSTLASKTPVVLVNNGSDKSILKGAKSLTEIGGLSETIKKECLNAVNGK